MKKALAIIFGVALALAGAAAAMDVQLKDGTVVTADSYRVTGSYVLLTMPNGSQVAYDITDVDLAALRAAEAARAAESGAQPEPETAPSGETISSGRGLKSVDEAADDQAAGLAITDRDVKHVRGSGVQGEQEEEDAAAAASTGIPPENLQQGNGVVLNSVRVDPAGEGRWRVSGEVINRNQYPALNVIVKLETLTARGGEKWTGEVPIAPQLAPDQSVPFEHQFAAETGGQKQPSVRATVVWMTQEARREPDYTKAGGVPHPSSLPLGYGGVAGADVRPTPVQ